ncbi:unnamed protein product [Knipowitschia caucasica]
MAVRWGAGEDLLTTCNMDIFPLDTLDQATGLNSDTINTLQSCLEPSILSMFEDTAAIEDGGLEEETEATLLSALTEILDNVDDENPSPFDVLPESDLLSGQKGREHSPLRSFRMSCSPLDKETIGTHNSIGKTLPMVLQRSDGEEEEDSLTPSPRILELSSDNELLDWSGLPFSLEQDDKDGLSVSLGDLVRQIHPYCMAISLEDQVKLLPEGGILLEVVDQGENGQPILAIPEMAHTLSSELDESISKVLDEMDDVASDSSEQIIVVDDDDCDFVKPFLTVEEKKSRFNVKKISKRSGNEKKHKNLSQRKSQSSKCLPACHVETTEGRVLRSASKTGPKKLENKRPSKDKGNKSKTIMLQDPNGSKTNAANSIGVTETMSRDTVTPTVVLPVSSQHAETNNSVRPPIESVLQIEPTPSQSAPTPDSKVQTFEPTEQAAVPEVLMSTPAIETQSPILTLAMGEPKPKSLSLAEYRRLRQQKKPAPVEKQADNSTKWPSLPEPPRELPPIPLLPEPSSRDPRMSRPQSKDLEEVKPAWMPRGPCAPPTPEALLAPPAYMVTAVSKAATTPQTPCSQSLHEISTSVANKHSEEPTEGKESKITNNAQQTTCSENLQKTLAQHKHGREPTREQTINVTDDAQSATTSTEDIEPAEDLKIVSHDSASPKTKATCNATEKTRLSKDSTSTVNHSTWVNPKSSKKSKGVLSVQSLDTKGLKQQQLIDAFTIEMGIEASDLTSLLEQFEETQAKDEQCLPEVSGRAVAVGNSSTDFSAHKNLGHIKTSELSSTALTPPGTPPHPLWKPLVPMALLGKSKMTDTKSGQSKVIEIKAQPLPLAKARNKMTTVDPDMACKDHDYCLPNKDTLSEEAGKRWNVKQHSLITIKPIKQTQQNSQEPTVQVTSCADKGPELNKKHGNLKTSSVLETPDASPTRDDDDACPKQGTIVRSYRKHASSRALSPKERSIGRSRVRRLQCSRSDSSDSDSHSSRSRSRLYSPPQKRCRTRHSRSGSSSSSSRSSSCSSSPPRRRRYSYSSSRSGSWSRSRSRSRSPQWRKRDFYSPSFRDAYYANVKTHPELNRRKEKAIEERRVVYVGRIRGTMTQKELKERFSYFGDIEECTLHFRDRGDNYGFVTYYNTNDAFMAIENGSKLRKPDEMPFDLCFGGRRQFCKTSYADLDSNKESEPLPARNKYHALDFDTLLKQAQQNMKR